MISGAMSVILVILVILCQTFGWETSNVATNGLLVLTILAVPVDLYIIHDFIMNRTHGTSRK